MFYFLTLRHIPSVHWKTYFSLHYLATLLAMVMSRFHYSVDVYIGFLVSALVCILYFLLSSGITQKHRSAPVRFLAWYEQDL